MIRVYLAAPFQLQEEMREFRQHLRMWPHLFEVTSRWLDVNATKDDDLADKQQEEICLMNLEDIDRTHVMAVFNPPHFKNKGTGGRHIETGYAIAKKIPIIIIGTTSTLMQRHSLVCGVIESPINYAEIQRAIEVVHNGYWGV